MKERFYSWWNFHQFQPPHDHVQEKKKNYKFRFSQISSFFLVMNEWCNLPHIYYEQHESAPEWIQKKKKILER